jgi:hypothetical protein
MKTIAVVMGLASLTLCGCANHINTMVAPSYQEKLTPVSSLGITGGGTSMAVPAFVQRGYKVIDIPASSDSALEIARRKSIPYLATVESAGTEGSWWDGFFDYAMRITETDTETIVWSATAEYGSGGLDINQVKSSRKAMDDMVKEFSKSFPPK